MKIIPVPPTVIPAKAGIQKPPPKPPRPKQNAPDKSPLPLDGEGLEPALSQAEGVGVKTPRPNLIPTKTP